MVKVAQLADKVENLSDFVRLFQQFAATVNRSGTFVFRGHASSTWHNEPSLFRNNGLYQHESSILRSVLAAQPESFSRDHSQLDRMVRMQHFSVPTRLLDVTRNPLVALYFCINSHSESDGEVVISAFKPEDEKFFDSDTISCVANLAYLKPKERDVLARYVDRTPAEFNDIAETKRLLHFIKAEKPHFESKINPVHLRRPWLVKPKLNNHRIVSQNGAFIIFGLEKNPLEKMVDIDLDIAKITIKAEHKYTLRRQLEYFHINEETMFPDLETASKYIVEQYKE